MITEATARLKGGLIGGFGGSLLGPIGAVGGTTAGYFIGKSKDKKRVAQNINNGNISEERIRQILDSIYSKKELKKFKKELEEIVKFYPKLVEKGIVSRENGDLIRWIKNVALLELIPEKERTVI